MNTSEWKWLTGDGLEMYSKAWEPEQKPRGVVCLVHGVGEHIGRYQSDGEAMAAAGYILAGFDQRGFGRSGGQRGHTPNLEAYLKDIDFFLAEVARRYPALPRFLYGHSMGAILVLAYAPVRQPSLTGVIATSPALKSSVEEQKLKAFLAKVLGRILPTISMKNDIDAQMLSRDPAVANLYTTDTLVHTTVTTGWGKAMLDAIFLAFENAPRFPLPLLLMHGTKDEIAYPSSSLEFAKLAPRDKLTLKIWEGFKHELHTDPEKAEVFKVMVDWLDRQLKAPAGNEETPYEPHSITLT
jgi:alpha-beta hydrolase superfamily lysophospholipase